MVNNIELKSEYEVLHVKTDYTHISKLYAGIIFSQYININITTVLAFEVITDKLKVMQDL